MSSDVDLRLSMELLDRFRLHSKREYLRIKCPRTSLTCLTSIRHNKKSLRKVAEQESK